MFYNAYCLSFTLHLFLLRCTVLGPVLYYLPIQPLDARVFLLARLMGQCCVARWRLSSVVVCNTAGGPPGARAVDTPRRASSVTSLYGDTLY